MLITIDIINAQIKAINTQINKTDKFVQLSKRYNSNYLDLFSTNNGFLKTIAVGTKKQINIALDIMQQTISILQSN